MPHNNINNNAIPLSQQDSMSLALPTGDNAQIQPNTKIDLTSPFRASRFTGMKFSRLNPRYLGLVYDMAKYCYPDKGKRFLKMYCRSVLWPSVSGKWFHQVAQSPILTELAQRQHRLAEIPHRPLLRLDNNVSQRLKIVSGHYDAIERLFSPHFLRQVLLTANGVLLAQVEPQLGEVFQLSLNYVTHPGKEGGTGNLLASTT